MVSMALRQLSSEIGLLCAQSFRTSRSSLNHVMMLLV